MTQSDVCRRIGRNSNFLCSCTGDMADYTYDLLVRELGVENGAFQKKEDVQPTKANSQAGLYTLGWIFLQKKLYCICISRGRRYTRLIPR